MKTTPKVRYLSYIVVWGPRRYHVLAPENSTVVQLMPLAQSVLRTDQMFTVLSGGRVLRDNEVAPHGVVLTFVDKETP